MEKSIKKSLIKTLNGFGQVIPVILGVLLLVSLSLVVIPGSFYQKLFTGNILIDPIIGSLLGSVSGGNPITSYIIGGELLEQGISLVAVTAFILSWVSVGIVQLPAEAAALGKKFAWWRNLVGFVMAIVTSVLVVLTLFLLEQILL